MRSAPLSGVAALLSLACILLAVIPVKATTLPVTSSSGQTAMALQYRGTDLADDATWKKAKCKGAKLLEMMRADSKAAGQMFDPPRETAESEFKDFPQELEKWGYDSTLTDADNCDFEYTWGIHAALPPLGISPRTYDEGGDIYCWAVQHKGPSYEVNGKTYQKTGALYNFAADANTGLLIVMQAHSPEHEAPKQKPPVTDLPDLRRASDIIWGQWVQHAGKNANKLRFFVTVTVTNEEALSIVERAIRSLDPGRGPEKYPGVSFSMDADEGKGILGSPNGVGIGYMLVQHKETLGNLEVTKVDTFLSAGYVHLPEPCFLFHIGPAKVDSPKSSAN
ncbi:hypothetical protein BCR34DRAFT_51085 [Clohesyomyces aquaticus]|uniref:Uncharacterized protein n=1 Tax=Clohesyomyces aquaticus TaxID=1231657 RepID=A0A1Y2A4J4_9PLEO|nr:hypothetical protein BCR34DRAFT_51085 [Clohesyomyces aquaticus]